MIRNLFFTLPLLFSIFTVNAYAAEPLQQHPRQVSLNRLLPRPEVVPFASRSEALIGSREASVYFQPLDTWQRTDMGDSVKYLTAFKYPFKWADRELILRVGSATRCFSVQVNDRPAGFTQSGIAGGEFDITGQAAEGNNTLAVILYKNCAATVLENNRPAGNALLTGRSYIVAQPKVRVRDITVATEIENGNGLLNLGVVVKSHLLNPKEYDIFYELISPAGKTVAEGRRDIHLSMRGEDTVRFFSNIADVQPWNHETPNLYTLLVRTRHEGRFAEYLAFRIGFRNVGFSDGKLLINNQPVNLYAHAYSPDAPLTGQELDALKKRGINTLVLKGYPATEEFYDMCDRMGFYVCNQADIDTHLGPKSITREGNASNDPQWEQACIDRANIMYHGSKNHPSVVLYSIARDSRNGYCLYETYLHLKGLEKNRPIVYADAAGEWNDDNVPVCYEPATAPVTFQAQDLRQGRITVTNNQVFNDLDGTLHYTLYAGSKRIASGKLPVKAAAGKSIELKLPSGKARKGDLSAEVSVEVPARTYYYTYSPEPAVATTARKKAKTPRKRIPALVTIIAESTIR